MTRLICCIFIKNSLTEDNFRESVLILYDFLDKLHIIFAGLDTVIEINVCVTYKVKFTYVVRFQCDPVLINFIRFNFFSIKSCLS